MTGGSAGRRDGDLSLPRDARITAADEIRALFRRGKRKKTRHLDVFVSASPVARSRLGLVVPKPRARKARGARVHGAAVQRNRLKRRLREIGRVHLLPLMDAGGARVDLLVRARPEAYTATFDALRGELLEVADWICSNVG